MTDACVGLSVDQFYGIMEAYGAKGRRLYVWASVRERAVLETSWLECVRTFVPCSHVHLCSLLAVRSVPIHVWLFHPPHTHTRACIQR